LQNVFIAYLFWVRGSQAVKWASDGVENPADGSIAYRYFYALITTLYSHVFLKTLIAEDVEADCQVPGAYRLHHQYRAALIFHNQ
jgi:hypothetical protein